MSTRRRPAARACGYARNAINFPVTSATARLRGYRDVSIPTDDGGDRQVTVSLPSVSSIAAFIMALTSAISLLFQVYSWLSESLIPIRSRVLMTLPPQNVCTSAQQTNGEGAGPYSQQVSIFLYFSRKVIEYFFLYRSVMGTDDRNSTPDGYCGGAGARKALEETSPLPWTPSSRYKDSVPALSWSKGWG